MTTATRLPTYFVSHGGGPWPWIKDTLPGDFRPLERSLQQMARDRYIDPSKQMVR